MFTPETIISILSFVLNSVLLSGFIIPQTQKLKEIKDRIIKFKITYVPESGLSPLQQKPLNEAQGGESATLQELLDIYRIRSNELSAVVHVFYLAVALALGALLIIFIWGNQRIELRWLNLAISELVLPLHAFLQLAILVLAIKTYATKPDRVQEVGYLVKEMEINPHSLISALGLKLSLDSGRVFTGGQTREDPIRIDLNMSIRIVGYRFLYVVAGKEEKIYFVSFGPITAKTKLWRHLVPPNEISETGEYNRIELGSFQFNLINQKQQLDATLLVFFPFFKHEKLSPLVSYQRIDVYGIDGEQMIGGVGGGTWPISTMRTLNEITYRGEGTRIYELNYIGEKNKVLKRIVDRFGSEIARSRKIKQYSDIAGNL